jgi:cytoskeletal protein RodZ
MKKLNLKLSLKSKPKTLSQNFAWNPIHPRTDWTRLLIVFGVVVIAIVLWSGYLFIRSGQRGTEAALPAVEAESVSKQVKRISSFFEKRGTSAMMPVEAEPAERSVATSSVERATSPASSSASTSVQSAVSVSASSTSEVTPQSKPL